MPQRIIVRVRDLTSAPRYTIVREIARLRRELERREVMGYFRRPLSARSKPNEPHELLPFKALSNGIVGDPQRGAGSRRSPSFDRSVKR